jgi:hypothetical protein
MPKTIEAVTPPPLRVVKEMHKNKNQSVQPLLKVEDEK